MADEYIRKQDVMKALDGKIIVTGRENADAVLQYMKDITNKIKSLEPADVVPMRHARWRHYEGMYACEDCGAQLDDESPFCPMCGAKMDGGENG